MIKKLTLSQLKVQSFVTYPNNLQATVVGGIVVMPIATVNLCTGGDDCQFTHHICSDTSIGGSDPNDPNGKNLTRYC